MMLHQPEIARSRASLSARRIVRPAGGCVGGALEGQHRESGHRGPKTERSDSHDFLERRAVQASCRPGSSPRSPETSENSAWTSSRAVARGVHGDRGRPRGRPRPSPEVGAASTFARGDGSPFARLDDRAFWRQHDR
jgi:hypothetical protein